MGENKKLSALLWREPKMSWKRWKGIKKSIRQE
jgi:hypothetical protein